MDVRLPCFRVWLHLRAALLLISHISDSSLEKTEERLCLMRHSISRYEAPKRSQRQVHFAASTCAYITPAELKPR
jgi:hypothetical protein